MVNSDAEVQEQQIEKKKVNEGHTRRRSVGLRGGFDNQKETLSKVNGQQSEGKRRSTGKYSNRRKKRQQQQGLKGRKEGNNWKWMKR